MSIRTMPAGRLSPAIQRIALNSTAVALNSTLGALHDFLISAESANARLSFTGVALKANGTGIVIPSGVTPLLLEGIGDATQIRAVAVSGSPILNILGWKRVTDK